MFSTSPLDLLEYSLFIEHKVEVFVKRDDLLNSIVSGNKYRKLKYILEEYKKSFKSKGIVSFGGAFSNHIHALAYICDQFKIPCHLFIRSGGGEEADNATIRDLLTWRAHLHFVSVEEYRQREEVLLWQEKYPDLRECMWIPEGGSHSLSLKGVGEALEESRSSIDYFDYLVCPVGTGATMAGLAGEMRQGERLLGISALKGSKIESEMMLRWELHKPEVQVLTQWHFGGYGKTSARLLSFLSSFQNETGLRLDPIYNGKSMFALCELIRAGVISSGAKVFFLHSGGLQGWRGIDL